MRALLPLAVLLLSLVSCSGGSSGVGNRCQDDSECETGLCYGAAAGGYCTTPCGLEGETAGCPDETVCKPIHGGPARCLLICEDSAQCPPASNCAPVSNSEFSACEPV